MEIGNFNKISSTWEELELSPELQEIVNQEKYASPSPIQALVIPKFEILTNSDEFGALQAQAKHGSGKTAAFVLGLVKNMAHIPAECKFPRVLVLAPTRELTLQIISVFETFCQPLGHTVKYPSLLNYHKKTDIFVSTTGLLQNFIMKVPHLFTKVEWLVLDEADLMLLQQSFRTQVMRIIKALRKTPRFVFFSATYPPKVENFIKAVTKKIKSINVAVPESEETKRIEENVKEYVIYLDGEEEKYKVLTELYTLMSAGQAIIFCNRISEAKELVNKLIGDGYLVGLIYGRGLEKNERDKIMNDFRKGNTSILVTTNLLARGIDVVQVNFVVNYGLPVAVEGFLDVYTYVHRVGRGGRFGRKSLAVNILDNKDSTKEDINYLEEYSNKKIEVIETKNIMEFCDKTKEFLN